MQKFRSENVPSEIPQLLACGILASSYSNRLASPHRSMHVVVAPSTDKTAYWNSQKFSWWVLCNTLLIIAGYSGLDSDYLSGQPVATKGRQSRVSCEHTSLAGDRCASCSSRADNAAVHEARHHGESWGRDHHRSYWGSSRAITAAVGHLYCSTIHRRTFKGWSGRCSLHVWKLHRDLQTRPGYFFEISMYATGVQ